MSLLRHFYKVEGEKMSRHVFEQEIEGKRYQVIIGWDRPVQQHFGMILEWGDFASGSGFCILEPVWSSLELTPESCLLEEIREEITRWGFEIPDDLLRNAVRDQRLDTGNQNTFYGSRSREVA